MILNLTYPDKGNITFKHIKYPDGQQSIELLKWGWVVGESGNNITEFHKQLLDIDIEIKSHFNTFMDLEMIICANQALKELGFKTINLYVPWFMSARSDRKFGLGTSNYLKTVICPIINSQNFNRVTVMHPHSDVLEATLNNFHKIDNLDVVKFAIYDLSNTIIDNSTKYTLVSPDGGSLKMVYNIAKALDYDGDVIIASKYRDITTGKILSTDVPLSEVKDYGKFIIVDDIIDGGRTFIELAKAIKKYYPNNKVYLIVTHGIFSAGYTELKEYIDAIYCTNSVKDINEEPYIKQLNIY